MHKLEQSIPLLLARRHVYIDTLSTVLVGFYIEKEPILQIKTTIKWELLNA